MPTYEEYYYKLKINQKTILDHIENFSPTPKLESGKRYEVVETSKGIKKGTIFKYIGFKDIWRQELIIENGAIYDRNGNEKECFNELIALHNGNAAMLGAQNGTIPKCKLLS